MTTQKRSQGFVTLIFILVIALIATLILMVGQSRLFVALQRGKSTSDTLLAGYKAESEINDLLYKIDKGYIRDRRFEYNRPLGDNFTLDVDSSVTDGVQTINVIATRSYAVSQIQAVLNTTVTTTTSIEPTQIMLMLDCTGSMNETDGRTTTRLQEQTRAARQFVHDITTSTFGNQMKLGIGVFGTTAKWLPASGGEVVRPNADLTEEQIIAAINQGFSATRESSPACFLDNGEYLGYTNIGAAFVFAHNHFANVRADVRKVEVMITDGLPNARLADPACPPDPGRTVEEDEIQGLVYAKCAMADRQTKWDGVHFGKRDPRVEAYGVTVLSGSDRNADTIQAFTTLLGSDHYFSPEDADQLSNIASEITNQIISRTGVTIIRRVIPSN